MTFSWFHGRLDKKKLKVHRRICAFIIIDLWSDQLERNIVDIPAAWNTYMIFHVVLPSSKGAEEMNELMKMNHLRAQAELAVQIAMKKHAEEVKTYFSHDICPYYQFHCKEHNL